MDQRMDQRMEVLLKEYEDRREENSWHMARYNKQANYAYLYASVVIAISGILPNIEITLNQIPPEQQHLFYLLLLIFGAMVGFYLFASTMDALFMMYINGIRAAVIEKEVNLILGKETLLWNIQILNHFFSTKLIRVKDWIKPNVLVIGWIMIFFVATVCLLCFLCFVIIPQFFFWYLAFVIPLTLFHIYQWWALNTTGAHYIWETTQQLSGVVDIQNSSTREIAELAKKDGGKSIQFFHWTSLLTILIGVFPMALLSISSDSFLPSSHFDFPFLLNISVLIGDILLLPIFNYYLFKLIENFNKTLKRNIKRSINIYISILIVSTLLQYWIHIEWLKDNYNGFMELTLGQLSVAGWWHFGFSSIQTSLVFVFLIVWYLIGRKSKDGLKLGISGWKIFTAYLSLGIIDFLIQMGRSFESIGWSNMLPLQWPLIFRIALSLLILSIALKKLQKFP